MACSACASGPRRPAGRCTPGTRQAAGSASAPSCLRSPQSTDGSGMTIGIVVADDHEVVRAGFAALLDTQPDFTVLGTAADGAGAVQACRDRRPDVALMDVRMPGMDGIEATRLLTSSGSGPRVLILTTF